MAENSNPQSILNEISRISQDNVEGISKERGKVFYKSGNLPVLIEGYIRRSGITKKNALRI